MKLVKRKVIGATFLFMALLTTGCSKEEVSERGQSSVIEGQEKAKDDAKKIKLKKIKVDNLSMKISKAWEDMSVEDMALYKIDELDNFSIVKEVVQGDNLNEYVESAKNELGEVIDLSNVVIGDATFNGYEAKTMQYNYDLEGTGVKVYQVCFLKDGVAYILTLCSSVDNMDANMEALKESLDTIKIK